MKRTLKQVLCDAFTLMWKDIRDAKWAIIVIIAYFVSLKKFLHSMCLLVWLTGYPCPTCGMTRAAFYLIHLDFSGAWSMHPFIFVIVGYLFIFCWERYILRRKAGEKWKWLLSLLIAAMILYYIWRMIHYFPGEAPMSYYYDNLAMLIRRWLAGLGG